MSINKCVITKGIYSDRELRLLISFDENNKPLDIINLDITRVGEIHKATVEKVLKDIDACIVKFSDGNKAFIENKKLIPDAFLVRHSKKKGVCQADEFYIQISQDRKSTKPYSANFISKFDGTTLDFVHYYFKTYCDSTCEIVTDLEEFCYQDLPIRKYEDDKLSLWGLYSFTKLLDDITDSRVYLKSGGNLIIEPTEAMTIIDVNSSKNYGKTDAFTTNVEAIETVLRQLRNRSISGIIIIDLLKVSKEQEQELITLFKQLSKDDISIVNVHGFTNLGLLEVTRSRIFSKILD